MNNIKILIFDLDGTLADSKELFVGAIHFYFNKYNYKFTKKRIKKILGPSLQFLFKQLKIKKNAEKIEKEINKYITKQAKKVKLCDHANSIKKLSKKYKLFIVTHSARCFVEKFLKNNNLKKYFSEIFCGEDFVGKDKEFNKIFKKYKVRPKNAVYIADKISDVKIARAVGCKIIIVLSCSWDKKYFSRHKKKFVVKDLKAIEKYLNF